MVSLEIFFMGQFYENNKTEGLQFKIIWSLRNLGCLISSWSNWSVIEKYVEFQKKMKTVFHLLWHSDWKQTPEGFFELLLGYLRFGYVSARQWRMIAAKPMNT